MNNITIEEVQKSSNFIASDEDDAQNFIEKLGEIPDNWQTVSGGVDDDWVIKQSGDYYYVNDCGCRSLYKKKQVKTVVTIKFNQDFIDEQYSKEIITNILNHAMNGYSTFDRESIKFEKVFE